MTNPKMSFQDHRSFIYWLLSSLLHSQGASDKALYVSELWQARALADLMSVQYGLVEKPISANPQSWVGIESIIKKESNCTGLYISYLGLTRDIFFWILQPNERMIFRRIHASDNYISKVTVGNFDYFENFTLRKLQTLPQGNCEDRSLFPSSDDQLTSKRSQKNGRDPDRLVEEDEGDQDPGPSLSLCYNMSLLL